MKRGPNETDEPALDGWPIKQPEDRLPGFRQWLNEHRPELADRLTRLAAIDATIDPFAAGNLQALIESGRQILGPSPADVPRLELRPMDSDDMASALAELERGLKAGTIRPGQVGVVHTDEGPIYLMPSPALAQLSHMQTGPGPTHAALPRRFQFLDDAEMSVYGIGVDFGGPVVVRWTYPDSVAVYPSMAEATTDAERRSGALTVTWIDG